MYNWKLHLLRECISDWNVSYDVVSFKTNRGREEQYLIFFRCHLDYHIYLPLNYLNREVLLNIKFD